MKYLAVILELAMFGAFIYTRNAFGCVCWMLYFWFSATRAMTFDKWLE